MSKKQYQVRYNVKIIQPRQEKCNGFVIVTANDADEAIAKAERSFDFSRHGEPVSYTVLSINAILIHTSNI